MKHLTTCVTLAVLAAMLGLARPTAAQTITFKFNPPHGTTVIQTDAISIVKQTGTDKSTDSRESKMRVVFKKFGNIFQVTRTKLGPAGQIAPGTEPVSVKLDGKGNCLEVVDIEKKRKALLAKITPASREKGLDEKYVNEVVDAQIALQKKSWKEYAGKFAGKTVKIGQAWKESTSLELMPGISVTIKRTITFVGMAQKYGKNCVRIRYSTVADPASLKTAIAKIMAERDKVAKAQGNTAKLPRVLGMTIKEERERLVDPATLLEYSDTVTSTRSEQVSIPGQGTITTSTVQKTVTTYKYE
ncbi:MAG: hypothetical protein BWY76_00668 [bacterium ADurb.Bin429]|nr:MAG: hypothetical protein BWY76_00668 [bacterium ADurb.Bin429]